MGRHGSGQSGKFLLSCESIALVLFVGQQKSVPRKALVSTDIMNIIQFCQLVF